MYCVYLTTYSGNLLPPFYVGCVRLERIFKENYRGTVTAKEYKKRFISEIKRNPEKFKTHIIKTFNEKKEAFQYEKSLLKRFNVYYNEMYINSSTSCMTNNETNPNLSKIMKQKHKEDIKGKYKANILNTPERNIKQSKIISSLIHINNGEISKRVSTKVLPFYLEKGWKKGRLTFSRKSAFYMHKGDTTVRVPRENISIYIQEGYELGYDANTLTKKQEVVINMVKNRKYVKRFWINDNSVELLHDSTKPIPLNFSIGRLGFSRL